MLRRWWLGAVAGVAALAALAGGIVAVSAAVTSIPYIDQRQCSVPNACADMNQFIVQPVNLALAHIQTLFGFWVDPRGFGPVDTCSATYFYLNDGTHDDSPAIQAAGASGSPVVIPFPGCKLVSQVAAPGNGFTVRSFGGTGAYDALFGTGPQAITYPYLFVPTAAATTATNNCVIDTKGFDGVTLENITIIGQDRANGTSAFCNSVGIANGRPQAFAHLNSVSITNMAGIGTATDGNCVPTGTLDAPVFQLDIRGLLMGHTCFGIYANYSDTHVVDAYMGNIYNSCISSPSGGGVSLDLSDIRCEFAGHYDSVPLFEDGAGMVLHGAFNKLMNVQFDHIQGACITFDGLNQASLGANWTTLNAVMCKDGQARDTSGVNCPASYVFHGGAQLIYAGGMAAENFLSLTPYVICFEDDGTHHSKQITFRAVAGDGPDAGGGWHTNFMLNTTSAVPVDLIVDAPGWANGPINNTRATNCTSKVSGTEAIVSGVFTICP